MAAIEDVEGIGPTYAEKLQNSDIKTVEKLLERGKTPQGRKEICESTEIGDQLILKWVNRADLSRVKGVGSEYADLLECAGVDTVPELAQRNAANLFQKMNEVNEEKNLVRKIPTEEQVTDWVSQAKDLPREITY